MADRFGKYQANVISGTTMALAPGARNNAALRSGCTEVVLLDDGGATATGTTIGIGTLRGGDVPRELIIKSSGADLSGVSFALGTKASATKYTAAKAGPAAGAQVVIPIVDAAELTGSETLFLTTSVGALPTTLGSKAEFEVRVSHK